MPRAYRMVRRADAAEETRRRITDATIRLHDEQGVAPTTFAQVAARAGVGQATVHRHFPTTGDLVRACGAHVWAEMQPPQPADAAAIFADVRTREERVARLVATLDAFYARGAHRLALAWRDREIVPELDAFLAAVEAGVAALVAEAVGAEAARRAPAMQALAGFPVWAALRRALPPRDVPTTLERILRCANP